MIVEDPDPRDTQWEVGWPVYRVYFWHQPPAPAGILQAHMGYVCDENRVTDAADVHEVLRWAVDTDEPGQTFTLYVEVDTPDRGPGLVRLAGVDPTVPD